MFKLHVYSQTGDFDEFVVIEGDSATIGRSSECNIVIDRKDISRKHARLMRGWVVDDLGSRNGTHVDGSKIDEAKAISSRCFEVGDPTSNNLVTIEVISADEKDESIRDESDPEVTDPSGKGGRLPRELQAMATPSNPDAVGASGLRAELAEQIQENRRLQERIERLERDAEKRAKPDSP